MSKTSSSPSPVPGDANAPAEPGFEAILQEFWEKNRGFVLGSCGAVLFAIVAWQGWQYFSASHERGMREDYARAAADPAKLAAFAQAHAGHALAGVAYLRIADERFSSGAYSDAAANYDRAAASLKNEVLVGRAKLGTAMSRLNAGDQAAGETALKAIGADASLLKSIRAEATYHLASLALSAGKADECRKWVEEVGKIDAGSAWNQRATMLLATLDAGTPAEATDAPPAITFKPGGN